MQVRQLTPLDTSFLALESENAHMHVGWVCEFSPPEHGDPPTFEQLRDHIGSRLQRAPRYRQRLQEVPLSLGSPSWEDDHDFDLDRHVVPAINNDLKAATTAAMSQPLASDRPLWEMTIVEGLPDGGVGVIGKAHHCMVDGIAAVELASLLLDPEPDPADPPVDEWAPQEPAPAAEVLGRGLLRSASDRLGALAAPLKALGSPGRLREIPGEVESLARAAVDSARPATENATLNDQPLSPQRHLGMLNRPLDELREIKRSFGVSLNDVLLAAVCGALREYMNERDEPPHRLKTMIPVNVRSDGEGGPAGNRISFMFVDLPCEEPDRILRLRRLSAETGERKARGLAAASEAILDGIGQAPNALRGVISRLLARPRFFNLTVSNIPGPAAPMYMCGSRLEAAYPVVPIPEGHALSVGMTSIRDRACFGLYADRQAVPDVDEITRGVDRELDELLAAA